MSYSTCWPRHWQRPGQTERKASLQEERVNDDYVLPEFARYPVSSSPQADATALRRVASLLVKAKRPLLMADYAGRNPAAVASLIELAELVAAPVIDVGGRFNFPNIHPLDFSGGGGVVASYAKESGGSVPPPEDELIKEADFILGLDMNHFYQALTRTDRTTRLPFSLVSA